MAKVNVNRASREELVDVAGLRPQVADAILKFREEQGGRISDIEALKELRGVGEATVEQLRDVLTFGPAVAKHAAEKTAETANEVTQTAVHTAKASADAARQTAEKTAEVTSLAARSGAEVAQRTLTRVADAEKATAERSGETATELSQLVVELMNEQMQANVETLQALARARTWREAVEVQNDYFRDSMERMTNGAGRYLEAVTRLMAGMAHLGRDEAKKAA